MGSEVRNPGVRIACRRVACATSLGSSILSCLCIFHRNPDAPALKRRFNHDRQMHLSCGVETTLGSTRGWRKAAASDCLHEARHVRDRFPMSFTHNYGPPHPILVDPVIEDSWAFSVFPALSREYSRHRKWV